MSVFHHFFKIFLVLSPSSLDPDPYRFCLDPDPYRSSPWIRIRIEVRPGSESVTNFFTSWIQIRIKMIPVRIRHTAWR